MLGIPFRTILQKRKLLTFCSKVKEKSFGNSFSTTQEKENTLLWGGIPFRSEKYTSMRYF
jgi:hypothetical protein